MAFPCIQFPGSFGLFTEYELYKMNPLYHAPEPTTPFDFAKLYFSLSNGTIAKISHQPGDLITRCRVQDETTKQCQLLRSKGGNQRFLGSTFGLCYTYNMNISSAKQEPLDMAKRSGEFAGLQLNINFQGGKKSCYCSFKMFF